MRGAVIIERIKGVRYGRTVVCSCCSGVGGGRGCTLGALAWASGVSKNY